MTHPTAADRVLTIQTSLIQSAQASRTYNSAMTDLIAYERIKRANPDLPPMPDDYIFYGKTCTNISCCTAISMFVFGILFIGIGTSASVSDNLGTNTAIGFDIAGGLLLALTVALYVKYCMYDNPACQ